MDLSIITVAWNSKDRLSECINSVQQSAKSISWEMFVVDNNSSDGSADLVKKNFPEVKLIRNKFNAGFAKANNQAIDRSVGEFILLLNPDMRIFSETLPRMVHFMRMNEKIGVAGCKLINSQGEIMREVRRFPDFWSQFFIVTKLAHLFPFLIKKYLCADLDLEREQEVDQIRGSFFMISRKCLNQIGKLDEDFFLWFDEVDFCKRAKDRGWQIVYTPHVKAMDYKGQSFKQAPSMWKQKIFTQSMCYYFKKHGKWWEFAVLCALRPLGIFLVYFAQLAQKFKNA
jgi:GT2 family glycosyltransferase